MQTDIAANSDSTLTYSHGASSPAFTSADRASTMCVCGEIGYAPMTSGRHSAMASATARDPSICLRMRRLLAIRADERERLRRRGRVGLADRAGEALAEGGGDRVDRDQAVAGGERADQRGARQRTPEVPARDLAGRHCQHGGVELAEAERLGPARRVDDDRPAR